MKINIHYLIKLISVNDFIDAKKFLEQGENDLIFSYIL